MTKVVCCCLLFRLILLFVDIVFWCWCWSLFRIIICEIEHIWSRFGKVCRGKMRKSKSRLRTILLVVQLNHRMLNLIPIKWYNSISSNDKELIFIISVLTFRWWNGPLLTLAKPLASWWQLFLLTEETVLWNVCKCLLLN